MIYFYRITVIFMISLIILQSIFYEREKDQGFIVDESYHRVRQTIIKNGWIPLANKNFDENMGALAQYFRHNFGYVEVNDCAGSGLAPCKFYFKNDDGDYLWVFTSGEDNGPDSAMQAKVISVQLKNYIE